MRNVIPSDWSSSKRGPELNERPPAFAGGFSFVGGSLALGYPLAYLRGPFFPEHVASLQPCLPFRRGLLRPRAQPPRADQHHVYSRRGPADFRPDHRWSASHQRHVRRCDPVHHGKEFAPEKILVNTVCIGLIRAGQHETKAAKTGRNVEEIYAENELLRDRHEINKL